MKYHHSAKFSEASNKLPSAAVEEVEEFIKRFPTFPSHYRRKDSKKYFFEMCLNEQKMYRIYSNDNGIESHVSKSSFRNIVQKFNIGYHKPQKDKCSTCVRYENNEKTPEAVKNYKEHIRRKDLARKEKRKDKMRAQDDPKFVCIIVDMAQVTPCPKASASEFYYISKLNCFNYSVYNLGTSDGTCYLWDQTTAKRGATECASGLIHYLTKCVSSGVTTVSIWSDTCGGQNRNQMLSSMLLSVVMISPTISQKSRKNISRVVTLKVKWTLCTYRNCCRKCRHLPAK